MARPSSRYPTELELEILKILWQKGPLSVREMQEALDVVRKLAYTSVMTMMNIMAKKGYLKRSKKGKSFIYTPRVKEAETTKGILGDMINRVFEGSTMAVMVNLLEADEVEADELKELRKLIDRKVKEEQK